jgi:hypothetical protein
LKDSIYGKQPDYYTPSTRSPQLPSYHASPQSVLASPGNQITLVANYTGAQPQWGQTPPPKYGDQHVYSVQLQQNSWRPFYTPSTRSPQLPSYHASLQSVLASPGNQITLVANYTGAQPQWGQTPAPKYGDQHAFSVQLQQNSWRPLSIRERESVACDLTGYVKTRHVTLFETAYSSIVEGRWNIEVRSVSHIDSKQANRDHAIQVVVMVISNPSELNKQLLRQVYPFLNL